MNAFAKISAIHFHPGQLSREMQDIASRIKGCAGLIDALADCENQNLGFTESDAFAAQCISRRLLEYAEVWQAGAKHVATPWLRIDQAGMSEAATSHAKAWLDAGSGQPHEIGELFEVYAEYLEPCRQAFSPIENRYSDARAGTDDARTFEAARFIGDEMERLIADIEPLMQRVYGAWNEAPKPNRKEGS